MMKVERMEQIPAVRLRYRPSIDGLRAVAVLLVVGFHVFPTVFVGGFIGVDVFFVISGFLISGILFEDFGGAQRSVFRVFGEFYLRRARRIFPALLVVLIACYFFGYLSLLPDQFSDLGLTIAASAGFCMNLLSAQQIGYFTAESVTKPLLHLWSLGVEEQFYLGWPVVVFLLARRRSLVVPVILFVATCSILLNRYPLGQTQAAAFYYVQARLWELLVGALGMVSCSSSGLNERSPGGRATLPHSALSNLLGFLGLGLIGTGLLLPNWSRGFSNLQMILPVFGSALILCAGEEAWLNRNILSKRVFRWVGQISYPLYLWHWPFLTLAHLTMAAGDTLVVRLAAAALAVLAAWVTYRFVERPLRHGGRGGTKALLLTLGMALVGLLGLDTFRMKGLPDRFPKIIRDLGNFQYEHNQAWRYGTYFIEPAVGVDVFRVASNEISPGKPSLFLWGDSHAAQLYPGYARYFSSEYNIVQRTIAGSAPILGVEYKGQPGSRRLNDEVFEAIRSMRPACVVLAANWCVYDWVRIRDTITQLKAAGIRHVVVIGPVPQWRVDLPQLLYNYYRHHIGEPLPAHMREGASPVPGEVDLQMKELCVRSGADYISAYSLLSDEKGFITLLGGDASTIVSFDYGHLTVAGSEYLVSKFPKVIR